MTPKDDADAQNIKDAPRADSYSFFSLTQSTVVPTKVGWFQGLVLGITWFLFHSDHRVLDYKTREKVSQVTRCLCFALITFRSLIMRKRERKREREKERDSSY